MAVVFVGVLVQFGMFPLMMTFLINNIATSGLTTDVGKLYAPTAIWLMVLVVAMAAFGYYASRAGEPLFGKLQT
jgi:Na+/H+-dicarboxylate symporter